MIGRETSDRPRQAGWRGNGRMIGEQGQLMVILLAVMLIVTVIGVAFVTLMNVRQRLAGQRHRALAARYLAEAGVERVLWALETGAESRELLERSLTVVGEGNRQGSVTIEAVREEGSGRFSILSRGAVGGVNRGVRVTAQLSPRILTYALFGDRLVRFEGAASRTYLIPASFSPGCLEGGDLGSNGEIWFMTRGITVNGFTGARLALREGEVSDHALPEPVSGSGQQDRPLGKLVLAGGAVLTFGEEHRYATNFQWLWVQGVRVGMDAVSTTEREILPQIDRATLRTLAEASSANAALNDAVGWRVWRPLLHKRDSVYSLVEFLHILDYLTKTPSEPLRGPIYVTGPVVVPEGASIRLLDGFLAVEGSLTVQIGGRLDVRHTLESRTLPAVMTIGEAAPLVVQQRGVLIVDGLVYAERIIDAGEGAVIDVKGAVIGADPYLSIRNHNATIVVRYDPSVLNTVGVQPQPGSSHVIATVVAWQEAR